MSEDLFDRIIGTIVDWFGSPPPKQRRYYPGDRDDPLYGRQSPLPTISAEDFKKFQGGAAPLKVTVPNIVIHEITLEDLKKVYPHMTQQRADLLFPHLNPALAEFGINKPDRVAAFVAQVGHETYQLRFTEEEWGPTEAQKNYEPPSHLATVLGNVVPGDGVRYKGRGAFQVTGRTNYRRYGHALNLPLEDHPELAGQPENFFRIAGLYWNDHKLSDLADAGNFREITRRINGGYNGEAEREAYWKVAKQVFGVV